MLVDASSAGTFSFAFWHWLPFVRQTLCFVTGIMRVAGVAALSLLAASSIVRAVPHMNSGAEVSVSRRVLPPSPPGAGSHIASVEVLDIPPGKENLQDIVQERDILLLGARKGGDGGGGGGGGGGGKGGNDSGGGKHGSGGGHSHSGARVNIDGTSTSYIFTGLVLTLPFLRALV
ncbi:hypothetical protein PsYK624_139590 [Phanerochaete sordida]|uniref:Uncharacterized protein n=1 Tax=Phanerochaete sordida TaxID=48140 RepID=A0A9P3LJT8_9APHY|nr:hypothetical protein PsYK624_139590 [Phanerochaete sordida]